MDVFFARACCLLENKCKDSKTDEKGCRIAHIKSHTWQTKKEKEKVLFRIQITPSVLLLDWVRAQVVSSKKCYFSDLQAYSKQHCKMCVCVCVPGFLSSAQ
jgi:hypothetical protein